MRNMKTIHLMLILFAACLIGPVLAWATGNPRGASIACGIFVTIGVVSTAGALMSKEPRGATAVMLVGGVPLFAAGLVVGIPLLVLA